MKSIIVIFILLGVFQNSRAECAASPSSLQALKEFVMCSTNAGFMACGGLAGAATARFAQLSLPDRLKASMERIKTAKKQMVHKTAELYAFGEHRNNPNIPDSEYKKVPKFSDLPAEKQKRFLFIAEQAYEAAVESVKWDDAASMYSTDPDDVRKALWKRLELHHMKPLDLKVYGVGMRTPGFMLYPQIDRFVNARLPETYAFEKFRRVGVAAMTRASLAPAKNVLLGGGLIGATIAATSEMVNDTSCSEKNDEYRHMVVSGTTCVPEYTIDDNVAKFLSDTPENQKNLLRDPVICDYYTKLQENLFAKEPKFDSLNCKKDGFELVTLDTEGRKLMHKAQYHNGTTKIRQINYNGILNGQRQGAVIEFDKDDNIRNYNSTDVGKIVVSTRQYLTSAYGCCNSKNRANCLPNFNSTPVEEGQEIVQ